MKTSIYNIPKIIVTIIIIAILAIACNKDLANNGKNIGGEIEVQFTVKTSSKTPPKPITKITQSLNETFIDNVQILVFEDGKYKYNVIAYNIINNSNFTSTFKARIKSSAVKVNLMILANVKDQLTIPPIDGDIDLAKILIGNVYTTNGMYTNLPMWGSYEFSTGLSGTTNNDLSGIRMLRSVACADIVISTNTKFVLATSQIFRAANRLRFVPDDLNTIPVEAPSLFTPTIYNVSTTPINAEEGSSIAQLHLPEAVAPAEAEQVTLATCVVIGGYYNGSSTLSYYRLDFAPKVGGHPFGQILRNYCYEFRVREVAMEGYDTPEEAANNPSIGMNVSIIAWQDYIRYMYYNDDEYLGVSDEQVTMKGAQGSSVDILVENSGAYLLNWCDRTGVPDAATPATDLNDGDFSVTQQNSGATLEIAALTANSTDIRYRYILVQLGKLKTVLAVIQEVDNFTPGGVNWAVTNVDEPGKFAPLITDYGKFYQWDRRVGWEVTGSVTGWNSIGSDGIEWTQVNNPCPDGWRLPTSTELRALLNNNIGHKWQNQSGSTPNGVWIAPTQAEAEAATVAEPGKAIFFPICGGRNDGGDLYNEYSNGYYWAGNKETSGNPYYYSIANGTYQVFPAVNPAEGYLVRCVKD